MCYIYFVFIISVGAPHTRLNGIKQALSDLENEINSVLENIKTEVQSKFDDINNKLNVIENNITNSSNGQGNENMSNVKDYIINV